MELGKQEKEQQDGELTRRARVRSKEAEESNKVKYRDYQKAMELHIELLNGVHHEVRERYKIVRAVDELLRQKRKQKQRITPEVAECCNSHSPAVIKSEANHCGGLEKTHWDNGQSQSALSQSAQSQSAHHHINIDSHISAVSPSTSLQQQQQQHSSNLPMLWQSSLDKTSSRACQAPNLSQLSHSPDNLLTTPQSTANTSFNSSRSIHTSYGRSMSTSNDTLASCPSHLSPQFSYPAGVAIGLPPPISSDCHKIAAPKRSSTFSSLSLSLPPLESNSNLRLPIISTSDTLSASNALLKPAILKSEQQLWRSNNNRSGF